MEEVEVKRGEIYYAGLDPAIGSEQDGIRPVLIISNDMGNQNSPTVIVASITGQGKKLMPTHVPIKCDGFTRLSVVMMEQLRTIDKVRLLDYVGRLDAAQMRKVNKAFDLSVGRSG